MASGPRLLNQALQKSITARAGARALRGQESVFIYTYRGEHRISTLIANKVGGGGFSIMLVQRVAAAHQRAGAVCVFQSNQKATVHVNNEQSRNCCSSRGLSVFAVEVPARTKMVNTQKSPISVTETLQISETKPNA